MRSGHLNHTTMGADLYINKIHQPLREKYQPLIDKAFSKCHVLDLHKKSDVQRQLEEYYKKMYSDGYFRDLYNGASILGWLGLSWWQHVAPLCTDGNQVIGENLTRLRDMIASAPMRRYSAEELQAQHLPFSKSGSRSPTEWYKWFIRQREQLLKFLDQAIALDSPVTCNL